MHLLALYIYPIKSLGGISLTRSRVTRRGLQYDRRYQLVDAQGTFLTQRNLPQLALFVTRLLPGEEGFGVTYGAETLALPWALTAGPRTTVTVWDDAVEAIVAPEEVNSWFSARLQQPVRLVYMPDDSHRPVSAKYAVDNEPVSFADGYPVLVISDASLAHLNAQLAEPIGMDRFRPNMVVQASTPHQEDLLQYFRLGGLAFKGVKPCARCVVTTINQQTATKGKEPLATLARYRSVDNKILFGQNVLCLAEGWVSVGEGLEEGV